MLKFDDRARLVPAEAMSAVRAEAGRLIAEHGSPRDLVLEQIAAGEVTPKRLFVRRATRPEEAPTKRPDPGRTRGTRHPRGHGRHGQAAFHERRGPALAGDERPGGPRRRPG
nr:hypothetical protein [Streptomyces rapamycinicus NRRL 5491]